MIAFDDVTQRFLFDPDEVNALLAEGRRLEIEEFPVVYRFIIDQPEMGYTRINAVYPETGGREVESVITQPAIGHWAMFDADGKELHYPITVNVDLLMPDLPNPAIYTIGHIRPLS